MSGGSGTSDHIGVNSDSPQVIIQPANIQSEDSESAKLQSAKLHAFHTLIQAVPFLLMLICTVFSQIAGESDQPTETAHMDKLQRQLNG